ncbi:MAG: hypothetical protein M9891_08900 [Austwickia sp.]|nr:hypothetical protein [Actinomycetota bacterium]MCB1252250.1 hypothetical protein [Austwickia sp.]MCO5309393.1 hypothetical protein [Austwickia sp.]
MTIPTKPMMALRFIATVVLSAVVAQAGWAAAYLGGDRSYLRQHTLGGGVTLAVCVLAATAYVALRRAAGRVNVALAIFLAAAVGGQYALGAVEAVGPHIFLGVLIAMIATALTSWTYRHQDSSVITSGDGLAPGSGR